MHMKFLFLENMNRITLSFREYRRDYPVGVNISAIQKDGSGAHLFLFVNGTMLNFGSMEGQINSNIY